MAESPVQETFVVNREELATQNKQRPACTECQRRKQKCNREWPCVHCLKRKVADQCRFNHVESAEKAAFNVKKKRHLSDESESPGTVNGTGAGTGHGGSVGRGETLTQEEASGFKELGYMPSHRLYRLALNDDEAEGGQKYNGDPSRTVLAQLTRALTALPPRPYTDILVQTFKDNVNFHYYILYPPAFLDQYRCWWADRIAKKPLDLSWTCLLLIVCACTAQYLDAETQEQLESDLGETPQNLTNRYQAAALELGSVVPSSDKNLQYVQYLLHMCYWYKSEARFVECWHTLNSAIREAQELGIHREEVTSLLPEFDREMRRRVWCILDTWDWQISGCLARPMIIDRDECDVELPNLALEKDWPSPILHMKLQSKLIGQLSKKYGKAVNLMVATPAGAQEYRQHLENWRATFPPRYDGDKPDNSMDKDHPWLILHRHYLQTMSLLMTLDPFKSFLTRTPAKDSSQAWMEARRTGIDYCLKLMSALGDFFTHLYPRDAKFHFILFCIFDVSAILCSAVLHDEEGDLPRRSEVYESITLAADILSQLNSVTKSARTCHAVLQKLKARLPDRRLPRRKLSNPPPMAPPMAYPTKKPKQDAQPTPLNPTSNTSASSVPVETLSVKSSSSTAVAPSASDVDPLQSIESATPPTATISNSGDGSIPDVTSGPHVAEGHQLPSNFHLPQTAENPTNSYCTSLPPQPDYTQNNDMDAANVDANPVQHDFGINPADFYIPQPVAPQDFAASSTPHSSNFEDLGFGNITQSDFGDFGEMWRWSQLDLTYTPQFMCQNSPQQPGKGQGQGRDQQQ